MMCMMSHMHYVPVLTTGDIETMTIMFALEELTVRRQRIDYTAFSLKFLEVTLIVPPCIFVCYLYTSKITAENNFLQY